MNKNQIVTGHNIYQDTDGRYVLYDRHSHAGYVIKPEHFNKFKYFYNRYLIAVLLGILAVTFNVNLLLCAGIILVVALVSEFKYRQFLDSLTKIEKFKPDASRRRSQIDGLVEENNPKKSILLIVLYLALAVLIILNGIQQNHEVYLLITEAFIAAVAVYFAIIHIRAVSMMRKKK